MTDDLLEEKEETAEKEIPVLGIIAEEPDDVNDPFLDGFGDENMDPEEADALALGYRIRGGKAEADAEEEEFFSGDEE